MQLIFMSCGGEVLPARACSSFAGAIDTATGPRALWACRPKALQATPLQACQAGQAVARPYRPATSELLFQHFHQPVCQVILRRSRVHQTFFGAEAKPRAESLSIDHAGVRPVELDLANAFRHNTPRRAVQLEFPTYDVRVWEQVA